MPVSQEQLAHPGITRPLSAPLSHSQQLNLTRSLGHRSFLPPLKGSAEEHAPTVKETNLPSPALFIHHPHPQPPTTPNEYHNGQVVHSTLLSDEYTYHAGGEGGEKSCLFTTFDKRICDCDIAQRQHSCFIPLHDTCCRFLVAESAQKICTTMPQPAEFCQLHHQPRQSQAKSRDPLGTLAHAECHGSMKAIIHLRLILSLWKPSMYTKVISQIIFSVLPPILCLLAAQGSHPRLGNHMRPLKQSSSRNLLRKCRHLIICPPSIQ